MSFPVLRCVAHCGVVVFLLAGAVGHALRPPTKQERMTAFGPQCFADYADFRAKWSPVEEHVRDELKRLEDKSFYEAFRPLVQLYRDLPMEAEKAGLANNVLNRPYERGVSFNQALDDGIAYEVALAIVNLQRRTGRDFFVFAMPSAFPRARRASSTESDRDHYCRRAFDLGTHRSSPFDSDRSEGHVNAPWLAGAAYQTFFAEETKATAEAQRALYIKAQPRISDRSTGGGEITAVQRNGKSYLLTVTRTLTLQSAQGRNCHLTNRVKQIQPDGRVEYATECTYDVSHRSDSVKVAFADFPDVVPRVGDVVGFAYDQATEKQEVKTGLHVFSISRKKETLGQWPLDWTPLIR
jgi:hypothetical protein